MSSYNELKANATEPFPSSLLTYAESLGDYSPRWRSRSLGAGPSFENYRRPLSLTRPTIIDPADSINRNQALDRTLVAGTARRYASPLSFRTYDPLIDSPTWSAVNSPFSPVFGSPLARGIDPVEESACMRQGIADRDFYLREMLAEEDYSLSLQNRSNAHAIAVAKWREATIDNALQAADDYDIALAEHDAWRRQMQRSQMMALDLAQRLDDNRIWSSTKGGSYKLPTNDVSLAAIDKSPVPLPRHT